jgi:hypothetical protein
LPKAAPKVQPVAARSASPGVLYVRSPAAPVPTSHGDDGEHGGETGMEALGEADGDD